MMALHPEKGSKTQQCDPGSKAHSKPTGPFVKEAPLSVSQITTHDALFQPRSPPRFYNSR